MAVLLPWMLSLLPGALMFIWPLAPAGETSQVSDSISSCLVFSSKTPLLPPAEAFQLPPCQLVNQTVSLEKEGCPRCHSVETTICSGHCITKVPPHLEHARLPHKSVYSKWLTQVYWVALSLSCILPPVSPLKGGEAIISCLSIIEKISTWYCVLVNFFSMPHLYFQSNSDEMLAFSSKNLVFFHKRSSFTRLHRVLTGPDHFLIQILIFFF